MVWHTCEGVSSIDQWIWDKGIKRFLFCLILSRLASRRENQRTFLIYNRSVIVVELNGGVWLGKEKLLDDNELTEV